MNDNEMKDREANVVKEILIMVEFAFIFTEFFSRFVNHETSASFFHSWWNHSDLRPSSQAKMESRVMKIFNFYQNKFQIQQKPTGSWKLNILNQQS